MPIQQTIDNEARSLSKLATDIDRFRIKYSIKDSDKTVIFASPSIYNLEKFRFTLLSKSIKTQLDSKYYFRPDYLSYDKYNTTTLWYVLLYINNVSSFEEFNPIDVIIPDLSSITEISRYNESLTKIISVEEINKPPTNKKVISLYKKKNKLIYIPSTSGILLSNSSGVLRLETSSKLLLQR